MTTGVSMCLHQRPFYQEIHITHKGCKPFLPKTAFLASLDNTAQLEKTGAEFPYFFWILIGLLFEPIHNAIQIACHKENNLGLVMRTEAFCPPMHPTGHAAGFHAKHHSSLPVTAGQLGQFLAQRLTQAIRKLQGFHVSIPP